MKRVISLWLPRLATDRIERVRAKARWTKTPSAKNAPVSPLATVVKEQSGLIIAAVNARAESEGVFPGQTLASARALVPALETAPHDAAADKRLLLRLADWCSRYSPFVAPDGDNGLFLDISGCAHLFGGESAMLEDLCRRIARFGFAHSTALADTSAAAFALSRYKQAHGAASAIIPPHETAAALAPLPVAALRLDPETAQGLTRLGLRRIGDLYGLPRAPLAARFGKELWDRLDAALGRADAPVSPRTPPQPHHVRLALPEPIIEPAQIARALRRLLHELCERLQREQAGARRLEFTLYRVDGTTARSAIGTARPNRDPERLALLFAEHLERLDPGFGVEAMALKAPVIESCAPDQIPLPATGAPPRPTDTAALIERLGNRTGPNRVQYLGVRESHVPERAQRALSAFDSLPAAFAAGLPRPPRLLDPPQPIEAVAPVPDDPPLLFRWRRIIHRVSRAEGPERILGEWWRGETSPRDYYRVEDGEGRRFWLFREGPHGPHTRWFLHGLFP